MQTFTKIDIANAKRVLIDIGEELPGPHLLIGGIAVNHYIKSRDSQDIDLICEYNVAQKILKKFNTEEWEIRDSNDDPERPSFKVISKSDGNLIINFGPKIAERDAYAYLDWKYFLDKSVGLTYQNNNIKNIVIPNPSYLAYMKLISFYFRKDEVKRRADLVDFVNLTNEEGFSMTLFQGIVRKNGAEQLLKTRSREFLSHYDSIDETSVIFRFVEPFTKATEDDRTEIETRKLFGRGDSDFISKMVDAALFFRDATVFAADEINQCIANKRVIPNRLLYKTEPGCKKWLELCNSPAYSFYTRSFNNLSNKAKEICESIINEAKRADFDFISLGVGDGRKDAILIGEFLKRQTDNSYIYYYPMDINITMIERAAHSISALDEFRTHNSKIRVKPFVGDFFGIDNMDLFYNFRPSPNVFSILGNTLGNSDESELIETLKGTLQNGDFLIIEVNTNQEVSSIERLEKNRVSREHDLSPLSALGLPVRDDDLTYTTIMPGEENDYSKVPNTLTSIAECELDKRRMKRFEAPIKGKIKLSIVHYYNFDSFKATMKKALKMSIVYESNFDGVGIVVLRK